MAKEKQATAPAEAVMYLGASRFDDCHVMHGTVFAGGKLPDHVKKAVESDESFEMLFVPLSRAGAAKRDLENPNSAIAIAAAVVRG